MKSAYRSTSYIHAYAPDIAPPTRGNHSDLATRSRILRIASAGALVRLEEEGGSKEAAACLTQRRLRSQRVWDVCRRYALAFEQSEHLGECAKDWLAWALGDDALGDEPELPWSLTVSVKRVLTSVV